MTKLTGLLCAAALAVSAKAELINCATPTTVVFAVTSPLSFQCGRLSFYDFTVSAANGTATGKLIFLGAYYDSETGRVNMVTFPNITGQGHEWVTFRVSGGVEFMGLQSGGAGSSVSQIACGEYGCGESVGSVSAAYGGPDQTAVVSKQVTTTGNIQVIADMAAGGSADSILGIVVQSLTPYPPN